MTETAHRSETRDVRLAPVGLAGVLGLPRPALGLVLFAHGSGSGRFSPRNTYVAAALRQAGLATLLFDLLTESEAADRGKVFDTELLAERLASATPGPCSRTTSRTCRSATSGRAPVPQRRWSLRRGCQRTSPPWSRAAGDPTWRARCWAKSGRRRC